MKMLFLEAARPEGLEPSTYGLEIRCSIRLSYGRRMSTDIYRVFAANKRTGLRYSTSSSPHVFAFACSCECLLSENDDDCNGFARKTYWLCSRPRSVRRED